MSESLEDLYERLADAIIARNTAQHLIESIEKEIAERLRENDK